MNKRQRKKQQTIAIQKAYQSAGYSKKYAREQIADQRKYANKFDLFIRNVTSQISEVDLIISQYEHDVNSVSLDIQATYKVDPLLASWIDRPTVFKIDHQLSVWYDKFGFEQNNQFYQNLQSAISVTVEEFDIITEFTEIVEDSFQATNNYKTWCRLVELEWNDRIKPIFYGSEQIRHTKALNYLGVERHIGSGLEEFLAL